MGLMNWILALCRKPLCECTLIDGEPPFACFDGKCHVCRRRQRPVSSVWGGSCPCRCCQAYQDWAEERAAADAADLSENPLAAVAHHDCAHSHVPNAETIEAMKEARRMQLHRAEPDRDGEEKLSLREFVALVSARGSEEDRLRLEEDRARSIAHEVRLTEAVERIAEMLGVLPVATVVRDRGEAKIAHDVLSELLSDLQLSAGEHDDAAPGFADGYAAACKLVMGRMIAARAAQAETEEA